MSNLEIDTYFYLSGDGEGGTLLMCKKCPARKGLPIAYYTDPGDTIYQGKDVAVVHEISELLIIGTLHIARHRSKWPGTGS